MTLPTFLGIGVQRGGSTWLHTLLTSHPAELLDLYREDILKLEGLLDQDLSIWLDGT